MTTPAAPAKLRRKADRLLAMVIANKFNRKRVDAKAFHGGDWHGRCDHERRLHLAVVDILALNDRELTSRLADPDRQEAADTLIIELKDQAHVFKSSHDVFMHAVMRLLCARGRNELEGDRS